MARLRNIDGVREGRPCDVNHPGKIQVIKGFNVRKKFLEISELAADILARGVDNPLWVRRDLANEEQPFILVDGERRHRALTALFEQNEGLELRIPVVIFDVNDEEAEDLMVRANMQRKDFLTSEKVALVKRYQSRGLAPKEIAEKIGMSVGWVDQMTTLAGATKSVRKALDDGKIGAEAALMLARKTNQASQEKVLERILARSAGKKSATAKAAAEATGTARRPGKKEVVKVIQTLAQSGMEDDVVPAGDARRLVILALNFATGEEAREALVQACVDHLNLTPAPELEPEPPKEKRGRGRPRKVKPTVEADLDPSVPASLLDADTATPTSEEIGEF